MTINYHIMQATIHDLEELVIIFDQYRAFYQQPSDLKEAKRFLFEKFEHQESVIFVAKDGETKQITGFTQLYPSFSSISMQRSWILNDLYVAPKHRKQGMASALILAAREHALRTHAKGLELSTAMDNAAAQKLYEHLGFKKDEDFIHYDLTL